MRKNLGLSAGTPPKLPSCLREPVRLLEHQESGIAWLQNLFEKSPQQCRGAVLADDMGLGKTLQLLTVICRDRVPRRGVGARGSHDLRQSWPDCQAATAGSLTMGSSLKVAMVSRVMYRPDREKVVAAFIEGCGLTEKGAVTYWYNCQRTPVPPKQAGQMTASDISASDQFYSCIAGPSTGDRTFRTQRHCGFGIRSRARRTTPRNTARPRLASGKAAAYARPKRLMG